MENSLTESAPMAEFDKSPQDELDGGPDDLPPPPATIGAAEDQNERQTSESVSGSSGRQHPSTHPALRDRGHRRVDKAACIDWLTFDPGRTASGPFECF
ncbi:Hypothetical predicted protein [Cloeon dipterum]|uniref:Uncharacterized protein n=1 Tax=Cloeon dipterum TaxID=197152 RepID=A0A8S1C387_9INSE|nr:Hypothetical predicted protein [Cloeon dipterum]